jgi:hypothetical protein
MKRALENLRHWSAKVRFDAAFRSDTRRVDQAARRTRTREMGDARQSKSVRVHEALRGYVDASAVRGKPQ